MLRPYTNVIHFYFCSFFGKNTQKAKHPQIVILYSAEGNLKYVSQTLHPSSQNTRKKGGWSFILYIYLYKTYGNLFRTLFQIYNGQLKKILPANIANKVTPLILINGGAYAVFRLLGKERINNRMSLAIVLKSALTFLRHRNPELARSPGLLSPRVALCSPCSRTRKFTVEVRKRPGLVRKTPTKKSPNKIRNKTKKRRKKRKAAGDGRGRESRSLLGSIQFLFFF